MAGPVHPLGREVEPDHLGADLGLGRDLHSDPAPVRQHLVIQSRRVSRDHHLARQAPEQNEKGCVVGIGILVAVPPVRPAGRMQIRRVAVDQFRTPEREAGQERVCTAMHQFHRVVAPELVKCALIAVNPDAAHRRGLAGHQRTATEMCFDIQIVRRLQPPGAPDRARSWPWIRSTPSVVPVDDDDHLYSQISLGCQPPVTISDPQPHTIPLNHIPERSPTVTNTSKPDAGGEQLRSRQWWRMLRQVLILVHICPSRLMAMDMSWHMTRA